MSELVRRLNEKPLYRTALIKREHINVEARTVELAFSSETPVKRYFGTEILDHDPKSVRLGRLIAGGPVLVDHNPADHVGVVESVSIGKDRRGRSVVRFGKSARADEIFNDVVDEIRVSISVGYQIHGAREDVQDGESVYTVTDWEPFEISLVSIPADASVGVGRAQQNPDFKPKKVDKTMEPKKTETPAVNVDEVRSAAEKQERARVEGLLKAGEAYNALDLARSLIATGGTESDLNKAILERGGWDKPIEAESPDIGLSNKELKRFSMVRAINALANPNDRLAQEAAAFEFECSSAARAKTKRESKGILIPVDILKRDLTVGVAADGGDTVATDLMAGSFIDILRNRAVLMQLATTLTDLNGNIAIPRQTGGATAYWVGEGGAPTESQPAFDQVTMTPKTVAAFTEMSRKLLTQSSLDVERLVQRDLAIVLALALDYAGINGSGSSNQPLGILQTTGIGAVAGGTNGAAPTWANIVDLETAVAADNADIGSLQYLTNSRVRGSLKKTVKEAGTANHIWEPNNQVNGYGVAVSNQVPSDLTKGTGTNLSAAIFGNFADLIIGLWGGLDLQVNPYSLDTSGGVRITAFQDVDIAVRHPESFAAMQDIIT